MLQFTVYRSTGSLGFSTPLSEEPYNTLQEAEFAAAEFDKQTGAVEHPEEVDYILTCTDSSGGEYHWDWSVNRFVLSE